MKAIRIALVGIAVLVGAQAAHAQCVGDCDGSNTVTVNELVSGVNIALDRVPLSTCPSFDADLSNSVTVNELITGVNNLLRDLCGAGPSPTPTPTTGDINTPTPSVPPPTITFQTCSFNADGDSLALYLTDTTLFTTLEPDGEIGIGCAGGEGSGAGGAGPRQCACEFRSFEPLELGGIGFVCITEGADECPLGTQVCDTASPVNITLNADANIGTCTSNADCAAKCDTYCGGLTPPHTRFIGACESQCQGGTRANQACVCDTAGTTTCPNASALACPLGSCEGKDEEPDVDCHCQCVNEGAPRRPETGTASPGAMRCRLPIAIRVESQAPCDDTDTIVRLPPQCAPFTSDQHTGVEINVNEDSQAEIAPDGLQGTSVSCTALDTSAAGLKVVTNLTFFDSTVGDIMSQLSVTCQ